MTRDAKSDNQAIMDCIRQIVHALEVGSRAAQKDVGLSGAQLFVLQTLAAGGAMSVNELAARSHTHQSSVSVVVSRLVHSKLVKRRTADADKRRVEVAVTEAGNRALKSSFITPQERLIEALDHFKSQRVKMLRTLLQEWVSLSGMDWNKSPMFFEPAGKKGAGSQEGCDGGRSSK